MTLSVAWWLYEKQRDAEKHSVIRRGEPASPALEAISNYAAAVSLAHLAGSPYHTVGSVTERLAAFNRGTAAQATAKAQHRYMVKSGMSISKSSAAHFAAAGVGRSSSRLAIRVGARVGARLVPGLGWALLAYDVYTLSKMIADS